MSKSIRLIVILAAAAALSFQPAAQTSKTSQADAALVTKAKGIHDRIIKLDYGKIISQSETEAAALGMVPAKANGSRAVLGSQQPRTGVARSNLPTAS